MFIAIPFSGRPVDGRMPVLIRNSSTRAMRHKISRQAGTGARVPDFASAKNTTGNRETNIESAAKHAKLIMTGLVIFDKHMIKLSKLADYGVALLTHLAITPGSVHAAQSVANATSIPLPTVSKLLSAFARADLVSTTRGAKGGFRLARRPAEISVAEIIAAIDGPIALTQCLEHGPDTCHVEPICPSRPAWHTINKAIREAFEAVSLADLLAPPPRLARQYPAEPALAAENRS